METAVNEYDRSWKQSKDKEMKKVMREIVGSFRGDGHPELKAEFKVGSGERATLMLNRWPMVVQYEVLKSVLQGGFVYFITVFVCLDGMMGRGAIS